MRQARIHTFAFILSYFLLPFNNIIRALDTSVVPHHDNRQLRRDRQILCRLILEDTMLGQTSYGNAISTEQIRCIVLDETDGSESDDLYPIVGMANETIATIRAKLFTGQVFAELPGAFMNKKGHIILNSDNSSPIQMVEPPSHVRRRMEETELPQSGRRKVTICRISTKDSEPKFTPVDLRKGIFGKGINMRTQFTKCSFGKLKWRISKHGVIDLKLPEDSAFYDNDPYEMISHAQLQLKAELGIAKVSELSDRVFMCLPHSGSWAASAAVGHWRAQFNNEWCLSLTGTMHEMGHTLGLNHANRDNVPYADSTGYMAAGTPRAGWPRKCFNAYKNWKLGFYEGRQQHITPLTSPPVKLMLATFVDYRKTAPYQPVVLNIDDKLFLQYNRAKQFNRDTGYYKNMITITEGMGDGSSSLGGLQPGQEFEMEDYQSSGRTLVVLVCRKFPGSAKNPDYMEVVIGMDKVSCATPFMLPTNSSSLPTTSQAPGQRTIATRPYRYRRKRNTSN